MSTAEQVVTVHEYTARAGDRLRVHWEPTYYQPGVGLQQLEGQPVLATMNLSKFISVLELNSGVMGHAAARKLERAGWRLDEAVLQDGALVVGALWSEQDARFAELLRTCLPDAPEFCAANRSELQPWVVRGFVDFLDVFVGNAASDSGVSQGAMSHWPAN